MKVFKNPISFGKSHKGVFYCLYFSYDQTQICSDKLIFNKGDGGRGATLRARTCVRACVRVCVCVCVCDGEEG